MGLALVLDTCTCCNSADILCTDICETLPTSITLTVSGLESDYAWCGSNQPLSGACGATFTDCITAAVDCVAECECMAAYDACLCAEIDSDSTDKCVEHCPCANANGDWVMEPTVEDPCTYTASFSFCQPDYFYTTTPPPFECPSTICGDMTYGATIFPLGFGTARIDIGMPWSHESVGNWSSGIISTTALCSGGEFPMNPTLGSLPIYADEIIMGGCGCGTDHSFQCDGGGWSCIKDDPDNPVVCDYTPQFINCAYASHTSVTVSSITVTP